MCLIWIWTKSCRHQYQTAIPLNKIILSAFSEPLVNLLNFLLLTDDQYASKMMKKKIFWLTNCVLQKCDLSQWEIVNITSVLTKAYSHLQLWSQPQTGDTSLPFLCDFERQGVSFVSYICVVLWFSFNPCITTPTLTSIVMIENSCSLSAV